VKVRPGFRTAIPAALGGLLGMVPQPALAHLVTTGLGPVYDGISHFLMSFEDLLPVAAMALLAGLNGPAGGRRALLVLPVAWLAGGLGGLMTGSALLPGMATAASALVLGGLVAGDRRLSPTMISVLAAMLGLLHGWLNGAGIAAANREGLAILGMGGVAFVIVALLAALVASLRVDVARIAVRVAGSWIAAVGLLLIGWQLRG
jgi:hydrogenase/urease accessory protein HupE